MLLQELQSTNKKQQATFKLLRQQYSLPDHITKVNG